MEADKENVRRTRIPLPKEPLPALPKYLLAENKTIQKQDNIPPRVALKTINPLIYPQAGPSKVANNPVFCMNIDTRHVTLRQRSEDLDWSLNVFKEIQAEKKSSIISISDDVVYFDKENQQNTKKSNLGDVLSAVTPNLNASLEPNCVKNIKRSLKRPHSRELLGLSNAKQEIDDDKVKRRLRFSESLQDRLDSSDFYKISYMRCLDRVYTADIFNYLLSVERKPLDVPRTASVTRACVINWLMKVHGAEGNPSTIQTACWYLDSILGTDHVQVNKLQLAAAACYWIAQKHHGRVASAARLVKCANCAFTTHNLISAETTVLLRLKFPQQPVVVQDYITYLCWYCDQRDGGGIEEAATFLYMSGLMADKLLCDEYPSVIAIAAVKTALLLLGKGALIKSLEKCPVFEVAEKKATQLSFTCSILRRAVRTISNPFYKYRAPLELYGSSPNSSALRIKKAVCLRC